jgi:hypothetical protein
MPFLIYRRMCLEFRPTVVQFYFFLLFTVSIPQAYQIVQTKEVALPCWT